MAAKFVNPYFGIMSNVLHYRYDGQNMQFVTLNATLIIFFYNFAAYNKYRTLTYDNRRDIEIQS